MRGDILAASGAGLIVGAAVGAIVTKQILSRTYEERIEQEVAEAKEFWKAHYAKPALDEMVEYAENDAEAMLSVFNQKGSAALDTTPMQEVMGKDWIAERIAHRDEVLEQMQDQVEPYQETGVDETPEVVEAVDAAEEAFNVFVSAADEVLDPKVPGIISIDSFMQECQDYDKISVTYFEGDGEMIDSGSEQPIEDVKTLMGDDFTNHWGKNSRNANVVYVRNHALEVDFEITKDPRTFEDWLLGPMPKQPKRKMKEDD